LDRGVLETADVFCIAAPATLSGEALEIIARRVNEGARLVSFLDGPKAPMLMFPALNPPFELQRTVTSDSGDPVSMVARQTFGELDAGDFSTLHFHRHFQNRPPESRSADTLLSYPDGSAALTISRAGHGAMVLVNLPLTPDGGDFIGHPVFPALLHELLRALREDSPGVAVTPGAPWTLDAPTAGEGPVTVTDPDGKAVQAEVLASGRTTRLALPAARAPGVYSVKQAGAVVTYEAVNVDPRESDTRPMALENLKPGPNSAVTIQHNEEEVSTGQKARDLWPQLAAVVLILLSIEMLMLALWRSPKAAPAVKPSEAAL
jgi:hypothetical protein